MMEHISAFIGITSLHGWSYLTTAKQSRWKNVYWSSCILVSIIGAVWFLVRSFVQLSNETPITFEDPKHHSLEEIAFPALTVCNVNQVRKSYFEELGIYENETKINHIYSYYHGHESSIGKDEAYHKITREIIDELDDGVKSNGDLKRTAHQACKDMFIRDEWNEERRYQNNLGAAYETDWGMCCIYHPKFKELAMQTDEESGKNVYKADIKHWKEKTSKVVRAGREKGYILLLDVESFDYVGADVSYEGFQLVVGSFHDQPIVNQKAVQIAPGTVNQIAITPSLSSITNRALSRFTTRKRHCYTEDEIGLSYFTAEQGYMYSEQNCIFESALENISKTCNCRPPYMNFDNGTPCKEEGLTCMDKVFKNLKMVGTINFKNETKRCLPLCKEQFTSLFMTASKYPNENLFVYRREFCKIAETLIEKCAGERKKPFEEMYPEMCSKLDALKNINLEEACNDRQWPLTRATLPNCTWKRCDVEEAVIKYTRDNVVAIHVFFPNPFVKMMIRDVKFTDIDFVANVGGLLGLCTGFSVVTLAEVLFHLIVAVISFCNPNKVKS